jgi:hypothetical protein
MKLTEPYLGKVKEYSMGTIAKFEVKTNNKKKFWSYFFAIAKLNEYGISHTTMETYKQTLPQLWTFIKEKGELSNLAMPILGSGFCRIDASREELFKEILLSFLTATQDSKFCNSLTFVVYYKDIQIQNIDLEAIKDFAKFHTSNFHKARHHNPIQGQPLSWGII